MQFKLPLQERVLKEQTVVEESGARRLKTKEGGAMGSQILQNPSDPDATYREKEGKQNRGYTANIVETVESMEKTEEPTVLITDGAYSGRDNTNAAIISTRLDNAGYHFQKTNVKTVHTVTSATPRCLKDQCGSVRLNSPDQLTEQKQWCGLLPQNRANNEYLLFYKKFSRNIDFYGR